MNQHPQTNSVGPADAANGADFSATLEAQIRDHVANLTGAHAVDEGNGDVLDAFIDAEVARHQDLLDSQAIRRRQLLHERLADLAAQQSAASVEQDKALDRARTLSTQILGLRAQVSGTEVAMLGPDAPAPDAPGSGVFEVTRLREFARTRRALVASERDAAAGRRWFRSAGTLQARRDRAVRRADSAAARLADREELHREALLELDHALNRFRGRGSARVQELTHEVA